MDFNEMNRRLDGGASKEQRIRELAESLHRRGLAMTKSSALELARSMVETENRVQQRYEERKESATQYPSSRRQDTPIRSKVPLARPAAEPPGFYRAPPAPEEEYVELRPEMLVTDAADAAPARPAPARSASAAASPSSDPSPAAPLPSALFPAPPSTIADPVPVDSLAGTEGEEEVHLPVEAVTDAVEDEEYPTLSVEQERVGEPGDDAVSGDELEIGALDPAPSEMVEEREETTVGDSTGIDSIDDSSVEDALADEGAAPVAAASEEMDREDGAGSGAEEGSSPPAADSPAAPAPREDPSPERKRDDLAKKHGIDLSSIFNVNK